MIQQQLRQRPFPRSGCFGSRCVRSWRLGSLVRKRVGRIGVKEEEGIMMVEKERESAPPQRLWSSLNPETLQHEPGSVFGAAALVAGTTVGAGILALPAVTEVIPSPCYTLYRGGGVQESGFVACSAALCGVWLFSVVTGLLIAEVNLNTMCELGSGGVSLTSMAERTLGKMGTRVSTAAYVFLHYALLVAYISRGGGILGEWLDAPMWLGGVLFAFPLAGLCYGANTKTLNVANTVLVALVIASFLGLLFVGSGTLQIENLEKAQWTAIPATLSVVSLAFVYQNIVPVIMSDLEGDIQKVRSAIVLGTFVPLVMFLSWDATILGSASSFDGVTDPIEALRLSSPVAAPLIKGFSIFALATSYIGFVLGLTDFISDAMKLPAGRQPIPYLITLLPPLGLAFTYPDIFFQALDYAGTYGVLVLFGVLPASMAWSERYGDTTITSIQIVPGGRAVLISVGGIAAAVIVKEFLELVGVLSV